MVAEAIPQTKLCHRGDWVNGLTAVLDTQRPRSHTHFAIALSDPSTSRIPLLSASVHFVTTAHFIYLILITLAHAAQL